MKIEKRKVTELIPYSNNSKVHTKKQINQIIDSIKRYGFNDPIGISSDNVVITGNGTLKAVIQMGHVDVEVIVLDNLNDQERIEYGLVHNKLTMNTGFDEELLAIELEGLLNMGDFGFDEIDPASGEEISGEEDIFKEIESKCSQGEIWLLGTNKLFVGEDTIEADVIVSAWTNFTGESPVLTNV